MNGRMIGPWVTVCRMVSAIYSLLLLLSVSYLELMHAGRNDDSLVNMINSSNGMGDRKGGKITVGRSVVSPKPGSGHSNDLKERFYDSIQDDWNGHKSLKERIKRPWVKVGRSVVPHKPSRKRTVDLKERSCHNKAEANGEDDRFRVLLLKYKRDTSRDKKTSIY